LISNGSILFEVAFQIAESAGEHGQALPPSRAIAHLPTPPGFQWLGMQFWQRRIPGTRVSSALLRQSQGRGHFAGKIFHALWIEFPGREVGSWEKIGIFPVLSKAGKSAVLCRSLLERPMAAMFRKERSIAAMGRSNNNTTAGVVLLFGAPGEIDSPHPVAHPAGALAALRASKFAPGEFVEPGRSHLCLTPQTKTPPRGWCCCLARPER